MLYRTSEIYILLESAGIRRIAKCVVFIYAPEPFYRVRYWKLFNKLLDCSSKSTTIAALAYWYSHHQVRMRWRNLSSNSFHMEMALDKAS